MIKKLFITSACAILFSLATAQYASANNSDVCRDYKRLEKYHCSQAGSSCMGNLFGQLIFGCLW